MSKDRMKWTIWTRRRKFESDGPLVSGIVDALWNVDSRTQREIILKSMAMVHREMCLAEDARPAEPDGGAV